MKLGRVLHLLFWFGFLLASLLEAYR